MARGCGTEAPKHCHLVALLVFPCCPLVALLLLSTAMNMNMNINTYALPPLTLPPAPVQGLIRILPRRGAGMRFQRPCETCATPHDGTFGAGRFCSSRCARTVGGLAHRRKRLAERGGVGKGRRWEERRRVVKRLVEGREHTWTVPVSPVTPPCSEDGREEGPGRRKGGMSVAELLNPC